MVGKKIEIFTDSSLFGDNIVSLVKQHACSKCDIFVYDVGKDGIHSEFEQKRTAYGVQSIPAVAIDGQLINLESLKKGKFPMLHQLFSLS